MNKLELYMPHIEQGCRDFAKSQVFNYHKDLFRVQCPGYDLAIREIVKQLLYDGYMEPEKMLEFLQNNSTYKNSNSMWW